MSSVSSSDDEDMQHMLREAAVDHRTDGAYFGGPTAAKSSPVIPNINADQPSPLFPPVQDEATKRGRSPASEAPSRQRDRASAHLTEQQKHWLDVARMFSTRASKRKGQTSETGSAIARSAHEVGSQHQARQHNSVAARQSHRRPSNRPDAEDVEEHVREATEFRRHMSMRLMRRLDACLDVEDHLWQEQEQDKALAASRPSEDGVSQRRAKHTRTLPSIAAGTIVSSDIVVTNGETSSRSSSDDDGDGAVLFSAAEAKRLRERSKQIHQQQETRLVEAQQKRKAEAQDILQKRQALMPPDPPFEERVQLAAIDLQTLAYHSTWPYSGRHHNVIVGYHPPQQATDT